MKNIIYITFLKLNFRTCKFTGFLIKLLNNFVNCRQISFFSLMNLFIHNLLIYEFMKFLNLMKQASGGGVYELASSLSNVVSPWKSITLVKQSSFHPIFFRESSYGKYLQVSLKKKIFNQLPGEPREQHLGDVRPKKFELHKIS